MTAPRPGPVDHPRRRTGRPAAGPLAGLVGFALALLLSGPAAAAEAYGTITLVQERRAGFLEETTKPAREVWVVRGGAEPRPAERGAAVFEGDVINTGRGACVVTTSEGWSVTIGEHSTVEIRTTWTQRLGTAIYRVKASFGVRVERVEVLVEGTVFAVTWDGAAGEVAVTEGAVRVRALPSPDGGAIQAGREVLVEAGERVTFTAGAPGEVERMTSQDRRRFGRQARLLGTANAGAVSRSDRLRVGLGGGTATAQDRSWGTVQLRARLRLAGPIWASLSGGAMMRPLNPTDRRLTLAFPAALGLHGLTDLPGNATISLGGSFDVLLGERCVEPIACERVVAAEPGATVDASVGVMLGRRLALSAQARVGAALRHEYGPTFTLAPTLVVAPRVDLAAWLELRL